MTKESTTPDLVELTQRLNEAFNARDIDAVMNFSASDIVWEAPRTLGTYEGRAAVRGLLQDWLDAFDEYEVAAEEIRDLGNGVIFGVLIQRGRPRGSTGWVRFRHGVVTTWVDGLVRRSTYYLNIDEARAAAERLAEERG
jgi:ketosteroid isomerase-like protein